MSLFSDLVALFTKANGVRDNYTGISITEILGFINSEDEIRFYVDDTPNYGHQATTVNIMKRIIDAAEYKGRVTIVYKGDTTPGKLAILIPELIPAAVDAAVISYGTCTNIRFLNYTAREGIPLKKFGFTGGADSVATDYATALNVEYFLRLQPYLWDNTVLRPTIASTVERKGMASVNLNEQSPRFSSLAYKFVPAKCATVPPTLWNWYNTQTFDANLAIRSINAQAVYNACQEIKDKVNLWPVYGLHQFAGSNNEISLNLVISALVAQQKTKKPTIILHFSDPKRTNIFDLLDPLSTDLANGTEALTNLSNRLKTIYLDDDMMNAYSQKSLDLYIKQISSLITTSITSRTALTLLKGYADDYTNIAADITAKLGDLAINQTVVISIGAVPQDVYNYFYANSGFPGIFEGQGTSSLVISLGKPFLQIPKPGEGVGEGMNYPSTLSDVNYGEIAQTATETALTLRDKIAEPYLTVKPKPAIDYYNALTASTDFILASITQEQKANNYFTTLGAYYQKDIHDKLMLGLVAVDALILVAPHSSGLLGSLKGKKGNSLTLDEVYAQLNSSWSAGSLDLLAALPDTYLSNYFSTVTGNAFSLAVEQQNIIPEKDVSGKIIKVTVSNATTVSFLGKTMNITLVFTADNGPVMTNVTATIDQKASIDGIPWIIFENPGFTMTVNEGGFPVQGGIMATIESGGTSVNLLIEYPVADNEWLISSAFEDNYPGIQTIYQAAGGVNLVQSLPAPLNQLAGFGLKNLQLMYNTATTSFDYMSFEMTTNSPWTISTSPLFNITPTVTVVIYNVAHVLNRKTTFTISGAFAIGAGTITITGGFPDFEIYGGLSNGVITLNDLFALFGGSLQLDTAVTEFNFDYNPGKKYYQIGAVLEADKPLVIASVFSVDNLSFNVVSNNAVNSVALGGEITILPDTQKIVVQLSALYSTGNGWQFSGLQTSGAINIGELLSYYLGWTPQDQFNFSIADLSFKISTATSYWEFGARTAAPWEIDFLQLSLQGNALIGYGQQDTASLVGKYGTISADVEWFGIDFTVFYNFDPTYAAFGIKWGLLEGKVEKKLVDGVEHQIATLSFTESTTIGSLMEIFVSWATGSKFGLSSPWDLLNDIPLNNLSLSYDFTAKSVSFNVGIGPINLGFATIKGIKVSYNNNDSDPDNKGVMVTLDIDSSFGDVPSWNAAKPETTPAPPGQGNKYIDLRMLAMGQHVSIPDLQKANTVQDAITYMENLKEPVLGQVPPVSLDADSSWLIGMDFGILKLDDKKTTSRNLLTASQAAEYMLTLQIIFNDPNLYALRIALAGDAAKIFKGLDFQIMYKKISDTVGVYQSEITLPDTMRQIKMGTFTITLPVFAIQIYTNGDFLVDIGFPWNQNFSRSLTFQGWIVTPVGPIPVMGSVGIYFGKLSSATTSRVPQSTTGTFNPVIVFGFGIQFGIGFSFNAGILSAGFSLTAIAVLEGILAKWNPYALTTTPTDNSQLETAYYFWFRGTVGIIGKLYGSIDFAIIKADLNVDIRIIAQITFASYEPILISLTASVDVSLTVTINLGLFKIHISFSFSARISQSITIQAIGGTAPWHDPSLVQLNMASRKRMARLLSDSSQSAVLNPVWGNLTHTMPAVALKGYIANALTMAGDNAIQLSDQLACYVTMLFIESVPAPQADNTANIKKAFGNKNSSDKDTSFEVLSKMIFRWAVASIQPTQHSSEEIDNTVVTDEQLEQLQEFLNDPLNPVPVSVSDIDTFMNGQFVLQFSSSATGEIEANATSFPVPDGLNFSVPDYGNYKKLSYDYGSYNSLSSDYINTIADDFDELAVLLKKESQESRHLSATEGTTAMSTFVFSDYFLIILRQMIQAGRDSLKDFKYFLQPGDTATTIVNYVHTNGQPDYTIEELFTNNAALVLNADGANKLVIANNKYSIQSEDTFDSIAKLAIYNGFDGAALVTLNSASKNILRTGAVITYSGLEDYTTLPGQSLLDIATAMSNGISVNDLISNSNILTLSKLLMPSAEINIPSFNYTLVSGDTLRSVAAQFNITQADLASAEANASLANLFDPTVNAIDVVAIGQFKVGELLKEIQATQGLQHLSGMTSRFYMAGLRLPTDGITPLCPGMWVQTDVNGKMTLPAYAGLYALTGQQFPLPQFIKDNNFVITYTSSTPWLQFMEDNPNQTQITLEPGDENTLRIQNVRAYATANRLETNMTFLGMNGAFNSDNATFPFTSQIIWSSPAPINMPYGGKAPGVPALRLWQLPDPLMQLPNPSRAVDPQMQMLIGQYNSATGSMDNNPVEYYGYATRAEFSIKKIPVNPVSPSTQTMYEIVGADGTNATILEKMVQSIGSDDAKIANIFLSYSASTNSSTPQGLQTDDAAFITMGIAQVNLSTETKPGASFFASKNKLADENSGLTLLNKKSEFITLLWEAGITRSDGFFLYYYNADSASGLPDAIFNDKGEATLQLIVIYNQQPATQTGMITAYYNALITAQAIDTSNSVLFAQSNPMAQTIPTDNTQTLATLAYRYFGNVSDVASDNSSHALRNGITITINEGVYEVGPAGSQPGGDLNSIADYFGTTAEEITNANQKFSTWPAPMFTSIFLPEINVVVGTSKGGTTLESIAAYYNQNLASLAAYNKDVLGIFADGGDPIKISGGPVVRSATVPAGVSSLQAVRTVPPTVPDDPSVVDFGKIFLQNIYSMLSYQLLENEFFNASKIGLPAGPASTPSDGDNDKIRMPKTIAPGDNWVYTQSIPYSRYAKQTAETIIGLPDPNESPYRGLGDLLKVDFVWQDYYGNRLITDLSQPLSTDTSPLLNQPPTLTGYTDSILGLSQWPSVASSWLVSTSDDMDAWLKVELTFDNSPYEGLIAITSLNSTTILATFTMALDPETAIASENYALVQQIASGSGSKTINILAIELTSQKSVTLTVDQMDEDEQLTLTIAGITNSVAPARTFSGTAKFTWSQTPLSFTTPVIDAAVRDLAVYKQLWYQLNDPNGIQISIATSLCRDNFILSAQQMSDLISTWIASIYAYLSDRATGGINEVAPAAKNDILFKIDKTKLNAAQIFKLSATFDILRTGGAVAGDFETTGGIKQESTSVVAKSDTNNGTLTPDYFAQQFEKAMQVDVAGEAYIFRVASGVDRTESNTSASQEIWAVRTGIDATTGISYEINNPGIPDIFAPRPISNKLESRPEIPIYDFNKSTGIDFNTPSKYLHFTAIDMDVWGKTFLTAIDRVLSPEFVSAILVVDNKLSTTFYDDMLANKSELANIIKLWMVPVFKNENADATFVQEAFKQQLLVQLGNAYNTNAGLQFKAGVVAETPDGFAPRLYGNVTMNFCFIGASTSINDLTSVDLFFNSAPDAVAVKVLSNYSVQGELAIISATLDPDNQRKITLQLDGNVIVGTTSVSIVQSFTDTFGSTLSQPLLQVTQLIVDTGNYSNSISITSPKLDLTPGEEIPLPFLLTSPQIVKDVDGAVISWLDLDLTFSGNAIEHQIVQLSPSNLYLPSSWLSFITADSNNAFTSQLGKFKVPMVLRAFPDPPSMISQTGIASANSYEAVDFNDILNWDYTIEYSMPFHFPQDQFLFTINFNVADNGYSLRAIEDAFPQLAEFITVFPDIDEVLIDSLARVDATTNDLKLLDSCAVALKAFNQLVNNIVVAANSSGLILKSAPSTRLNIGTLPYIFILSEGKTTIESTDALIVSIDTKAPDGMGDPIVELVGCTTHSYTDISKSLGAYNFYFTDADGKIVSASDGQNIKGRSIRFPKINILARQDAETLVELKRNSELIKGMPSADQFVYTTGQVRFANNYHPTIDYGKQLEISTIDAPLGQNNNLALAAQFENLFANLLAQNTQPVLSFLMTCTYSYSINPAIENITLPVFMQPLQDISVLSDPNSNNKDLDEMITGWTGAIKTWYTNYQPDLTNASLCFNLTIFSNLNEQPLPLLKLSNLTLECQFINDLKI